MRTFVTIFFTVGALIVLSGNTDAELTVVGTAKYKGGSYKLIYGGWSFWPDHVA